MALIPFGRRVQPRSPGVPDVVIGCGLYAVAELARRGANEVGDAAACGAAAM
jgi:hypothetical protein